MQVSAGLLPEQDARELRDPLRIEVCGPTQWYPWLRRGDLFLRWRREGAREGGTTE